MDEEQGTQLQQSARGAAAAEGAPQQQPRRGLWGLLGIIALVVLVILLLLMLRDCGGGSGADEGSVKTIEDVRGLSPVSGAVSLWVKPEAEIEKVLLLANAAEAEFLDMGEGRYVLQVPEGSEQEIADRLAELENVYDAGLVYQSPLPAEDETPTP